LKSESHKWFDQEVREAIAARRAKHAEFLRTGDNSAWKEYCSLRKSTKRLVFEKKQAAWNETMDAIADAFFKNKKLFWSLMNRFGGGSKSYRGPVQTATGALVSDPEQKKEAWAAFFEELGKRTQSDQFDNAAEQEISQRVKSYVRACCQVPEDVKLDAPFTEDEVSSVLQELPNGKSHALDFVPNEFLKHGGEPMVKALTQLFNAVWSEEQVPESWRNGLIFTIYKDGK
jgi:hypothetical protein